MLAERLDDYQTNDETLIVRLDFGLFEAGAIL